MEKRIESIVVSDIPDTARLDADGCMIPLVTSENISFLISKINEPIVEVNELKELHS